MRMFYKVGRTVEVDIVRQYQQRATWAKDTETNIVLEIRIGMP